MLESRLHLLWSPFLILESDVSQTFLQLQPFLSCWKPFSIGWEFLFPSILAFYATSCELNSERRFFPLSFFLNLIFFFVPLAQARSQNARAFLLLHPISLWYISRWWCNTNDRYRARWKTLCVHDFRATNAPFIPYALHFPVLSF